MRFLYNGVSIVLSLALYSQEHKTQILDYKVLFSAKNNTKVSCYRIPAIVTAPNGVLVAAIDERVPSCGDLKWSNDINIVLRRSNDNGKTWYTQPDSLLIDPSCNASIIRYTSIINGDDKNRLLFSNAKKQGNRMNMTVRISYDEGKTWTKGKTIYSGSAAYSSMTVLNNGDIGLFFEKDNYAENVFVRLTLEWLTNGKDVYKRDK